MTEGSLSEVSCIRTARGGPFGATEWNEWAAGGQRLGQGTLGGALGWHHAAVAIFTQRAAASFGFGSGLASGL